MKNMEEEKNIQLEQPEEEKTEEQIVLPLEEGEPGDEGYHFPWTILIVGGALLLAIVACIIVIMLNGGFND